MPKQRKPKGDIRRGQTYSYDPKTLEIIKRVADIRFNGNRSMAAEFLVLLGEEEDKRREAERNRISQGSTQFDPSAFGVRA